MARIGWVELREERPGAHLRNFRAARVERIAVPEVYFEVRSNAPRSSACIPGQPHAASD